MSERPHVIHLAADHAGFAHKEHVEAWLTREGFEVYDHGAHQLAAEDDYPDFIAPAAEAVSKAPGTARGVIFGGSGQGEAMVANRFRGVRATVYYGGPDDIIALSRSHNDANVLSIGARFVSPDEATRVIWDWLHASFGGDARHERRIKKLEQLTRPLH